MQAEVVRLPKVEVQPIVVARHQPVKRVHQKLTVARPAAQQLNYDDGPVVRVVIPAEALFAPGAVPAGAQIYADLVLAADGSARELRLLP